MPNDDTPKKIQFDEPPPRKAPAPQVVQFDSPPPAEPLDPFHKGLGQGVLSGFGFHPTDPNDPRTLTFKDAGLQLWENIKRGAGESYARLGGASDEELDKAPVYRVDVPLRSAAAVLFSPVDMLASGIEGMAATLEGGSKELLAGVRAGDHEMTGRGVGKVLASLGQVAMGIEGSNPAVVGPAKTAFGRVANAANLPDVARAAGRVTEFAPKAVEGAELVGKTRPANILQGSINRSVGALARDVRFGDPSVAMVEEGINWPGTKGRLAQVNAKLAQLGPQLKNALDNAKGKIPLDDVLDPVVKKYKEKVRLSNETAAVKQAAYNDLQTLRDTAHEHAPSGNATAAEANSFKQAVGDSVNWEKRPTAMHDLVLDGYRETYSAVRDAVNNRIGKQAADLNRRISNLKAAQSGLRELYVQLKAGRTPGFDLSHPFNAAKSAVGNASPFAISAAQDVAGALEPAARIGAAAGLNAGFAETLKKLGTILNEGGSNE